MSISRALPAVVVAVAALLVGGCGGGGPDGSDEEILEAWADLVCAEEPTEHDRLLGGRGATVTMECPSKHSTEKYGGDEDKYGDDMIATALITIYDDPFSAARGAESEGETVDVAYDVVAGSRWVSRLYDVDDSDALVAAGGELLSEGE